MDTTICNYCFTSNSTSICTSSTTNYRRNVMAGTVIGGKNAAATNKKKYGNDFFKRIGAIGGKKGTTGGFYANRELAREAGRIGGLKSRRGKKND